MLSRRTLMASAALIPVGCSFINSQPESPAIVQGASLIWAVADSFASLAGTRGMSALEKFELAAAELAQDEENPRGLKQGRYTLSLRRISPWLEREQYAATLADLGADLVTVGPYNAQVLGEQGVLLPLDRFTGSEGTGIEREFYPNVLAQFQRGALYALPVGVRPQVLYYDAALFRREGVSAPHSNWGWDDLVVNAAKLTERRANGSVARWGLATHSQGLWWALWQNEAAVLDLDGLQCRLQEPSALEALQFCYDLLHTHRVSPAEFTYLGRMIYESGNPPAMVYELPPKRPSAGEYRLAQLPRGKVRAVPVYGEVGIAIAARTSHPEEAYTALRGLVGAMQPYVIVPTQREAMARLGEFRKDLRPEEITALQQSMEHESGWPLTGVQLHVIRYIVEALVQGDDVASVVNEACSIVREYQQAERTTREQAARVSRW